MELKNKSYEYGSKITQTKINLIIQNKRTSIKISNALLDLFCELKEIDIENKKEVKKQIENIFNEKKNLETDLDFLTKTQILETYIITKATTKIKNLNYKLMFSE